MDRREFIRATGVSVGAGALVGCLDGEDLDDATTRQQVNNGGGSTADGEGGSDDTSTESDDSEEPEPEEETCHTESETRTEAVVDNSRSLDGGFEWTHEYRVQAGDRAHFDISASDGQDIRVEIDSPQGQTVYQETGLALSPTHSFGVGGSGEIRIANLGERTKEEREELWEDRREVSAGATNAPWAEIREGNAVDYYIRMISGARPMLRIEDARGNTLREHSVAEVIDDTFTAPEDGRYYFIMENTAFITSGTWDFTFERVNEVPIPTRVDLTVEREYEEEIEICE